MIVWEVGGQYDDDDGYDCHDDGDDDGDDFVTVFTSVFDNLCHGTGTHVRSEDNVEVTFVPFVSWNSSHQTCFQMLL